MKSLEDRKFDNYSKLRSLLIEAADEVLDKTKTYVVTLDAMKQSIKKWESVVSVFQSILRENSELGKETESGFILYMIAPESKNEKDPIHDDLSIMNIDNLFWAKRIVNNAFYELISGRLDNKNNATLNE